MMQRTRLVEKGHWQEGEDELRIVIRVVNAHGSAAAVILPGINRYWRRCVNNIANKGGNTAWSSLDYKKVVRGRLFVCSRSKFEGHSKQGVETVIVKIIFVEVAIGHVHGG